MLTTIKNWRHDRRSPAKPRPAKLVVETLGDRTLPSAVLADGQLTITGTGRHDVVRVSREFVLGRWYLRVAEQTRVGTSLSSPDVHGFWESDVRRIVFNGRNCDDRFTNNTAIPGCANGGDGRDILFGGTGADTLCGDSGSDRLYGRGGDDQLNGNGGDDWLFGGAGNDTLSGNGGGDRLFGDLGDDVLRGGDGGDRLYGNDGGDDLNGGDGLDTLRGGAGPDVLDGGNDDRRDELWGETSGDTFVRHHRGPRDAEMDFVRGVDRFEVR